MELLGLFWQEYGYFALLLLCLIAFCAGFVDSIAGGGGLFLVPGFLLVGMPPQVALGQEKIVSTFGTLAAIRNFLKDHKMVWGVIGIGIPFSLIGAYAGAHSILLIDPKWVAKLLLLLIPAGIILFLIPKDKNIIGDKKVEQNVQFYIKTSITCFVVGFYDGFFGPGAGSMFIIAFHYLLKLNLIQASANTKIFNLASNAGALVAFVIAGKIIYTLALPLVISNVFGNHVGSNMAVKKGGNLVKSVLIFSILCLFISLCVKYLY
ncbi:hypothetical protein CWC46_10915 [Prodigiosinella confusarubida]|uniref:Probable membrane transporter protein n=1 Tax=Serratia sp. (strain ATCC 39006) TaxID=104623 RepID=A0A2I5T6Q6_SERS3|nr:MULTISPECIES: TSUP family transporter [Enterobacterales]AUH00270.1 hypothetical protein CWC46_10915 [Serratia sp. ATCC 39006]AUH04590.1 hypothetical protein Ser39006_010920 [Serratia sp. ATCC 39006]WJV52465.1 TSUP family transporter [Prodigiosinella sp. LS101]WJV56819.1 TSUP family transporter [Pectobacteriaceae bacterium C111]